MPTDGYQNDNDCHRAQAIDDRPKRDMDCDDILADADCMMKTCFGAKRRGLWALTAADAMIQIQCGVRR